jgi:gluconolactonase
MKIKSTTVFLRPTFVNPVCFYLLFLFNLMLINLAKAQNQDTPQMVVKEKAFLKIIAKKAKWQKLASGFQFVEGPLWHPKGYLIFSDIPANHIYQLSNQHQPKLFLDKSGYTGNEAPVGEIGSNGLAWDNKFNLLLCQHGDRRVARLLAGGKMEIIADRYQGRKFNSPNDLICTSTGSIYFTDPSWGLEKNSLQPKREINFNGVYKIYQGTVVVIDSTLMKPNGIAISPDEKTLYVADINQIWWKYELNEDGSVRKKAIFFDASSFIGVGYMDGIEIDSRGNVYATAPGGIWVFSAEGKHLGTIPSPEIASNLAWGGKDFKTLYATCQGSIYAIRLKIKGLNLKK